MGRVRLTLYPSIYRPPETQETTTEVEEPRATITVETKKKTEKRKRKRHVG